MSSLLLFTPHPVYSFNIRWTNTIADGDDYTLCTNRYYEFYSHITNTDTRLFTFPTFLPYVLLAGIYQTLVHSLTVSHRNCTALLAFTTVHAVKFHGRCTSYGALVSAVLVQCAKIIRNTFNFSFFCPLTHQMHTLWLSLCALQNRVPLTLTEFQLEMYDMYTVKERKGLGCIRLTTSVSTSN